MTTERKPRSRRRAGGKGATHSSSGPTKSNFVREVGYFDLVAPDALNMLHEASCEILEEIGIEFRHDTALEIWRGAGARVDGQRVYIPRDLLMGLVAKAPSEYIYNARNPARNVRIGGKNMGFAPTYGCPFIRDVNGVRRYAKLSDLEDLVKLTHLSAPLNISGSIICEPVDVPVPHRHLEVARTHLKLGEKPIMGSVTSADNARDCVEIAKLVWGSDFLPDNVVMTNLVNCNSPLVWDDTMLDAAMVYAEHGQAMMLAPFAMQGANSPITTAGTVAQVNAEALAGIAFVQLVRPGNPVVYGAPVSVVSMKSGSPMYATSDGQHSNFVLGQLARRYGIPYRVSGARTGSKTLDAQAGYETVLALMPSLMTGVNYVLHAAGWLESVLTVATDKFVMDVEVLTVLQRMLAGMPVNAETLALDTIREVGPGGHHFASAHTLKHYESAFFMPETFDVNSFEQWSAAGELSSADVAKKKAADLLANYEAPEIDAALTREIDRFVDARKGEIKA
ncbi:MAG: trimethylamine methyltransferase family protein [Pseudomonadota bacterium]